ncbi:MAG: Thiol:disulfide interchange protein TlpA [Formosa sp. Hel1_33_131]|nr:MAG: Thiol:disulfide interchange protein TlpA [Formosa sp. Hel1_33_131]
MKSFFTLLLSILIFSSCTETPKNYVTLSGEITNFNEFKKITISNREGYKKEIQVNDDGTFSDTLHIKEGLFTFFDGNEVGMIYLKNNNSTSFTLDTNAFDETLKFKGDGADKSNFIITNNLLQEKYLQNIFDGSEAEFSKSFNDLEVVYNSLKNEFKQLDAAFFEEQSENLKLMRKSYYEYFLEKQGMKTLFPKGMASPEFTNYENHKGGVSSLSDFKGKFVYVDIWATWCGPCKVEIPFLQELESKYHAKNIEFISISVDDARRSGTLEKAHEAWKTMVSEKELSGVQLFSGNGWKTDFIQDYKISGIPRFILIDPNGNIIDADAPRPSSEGLISLLDELGI